MGQQNTLIVGKHYPAIDSLRALAIILVFWWHSTYGSYEVSYAMTQNFSQLEDIYTRVAVFGASGVNLFFIISGFLITGLILDTRHDKKCLQKFYIRRALRIFPAYYAGLALISIVAMLCFSVDFDIKDRIFSYIFYLQNMDFLWRYTTPFGQVEWKFFNHFWSLAIEEQFYLIWPTLILLMTNKMKAEKALLLMLKVVFLSIILRNLMTDIYGWEHAYIFLFSRVDALVMGAMIAYMFRMRPQLFEKIKELSQFLFGWLVAILFLLVVVMIFSNVLWDFNVKVLVTFMNVFYLVLLVKVLHWEENNHKEIFRQRLGAKIINEIARISYGIYIVHAPLTIIVAKYITTTGVTNFWLILIINTIVSGTISFVLAYLSYHYFEKRFLRLKDKYAPL